MLPHWGVEVKIWKVSRIYFWVIKDNLTRLSGLNTKIGGRNMHTESEKSLMLFETMCELLMFLLQETRCSSKQSRFNSFW